MTEKKQDPSKPSRNVRSATAAGPLKRRPGERDAGKEWMLAFQKGDIGAFDRIVVHYQEGVKKFIGRYLADVHRADDLAQEAFLRVYRARRRYRPTAKFHTWLYTIVTRLCLNEIRSLQRERRVLPVQGGGAGRGHSGDGFGDDLLGTVSDANAETPAARLEREELEGVILRTIEQLPGNQRAAILLLRYEDAAYQEIAEVLDISVMAVKSLINRARETLRRRIASYGEGKVQPRSLLRPPRES